MKPFFVKPIVRLFSSKAFSLIEVLLVVSVLAILGAALFNTFSNGFKIWKKTQRSGSEIDVVLFFEKINQDLRNSFTLSTIPWQTKPDQIFFPTMIALVRGDGTSRLVHQPGQVGYEFDPQKRTLVRWQSSYAQAVDTLKGAPRVLINNVQDVRFEYQFSDKNPSVVGASDSSLIPMSVSITVDFLESPQNKMTLRKVILLPQGY